MGVKIFIEGQRLDLFKDETIVLRQSVQDVKDISKIFADYSQSFTVPASATNNEIFEHYYNADITGGYDARTRKEGSINVDDLDFKRGKIRLDEVKIENGVASQYKITFFGDVIKIKDLIGDDKLNVLTWLDNFNHSYDGDQVLTGLITGLDFTVDSVDYDAAVIYPLISYQKQWYYNDAADTTNTDTLVNIANNGSVGIDSTNLKPAIQLWLVVKAIEEKYGLIFSSPFFDSELFKQIYMNLNAETESLVTGSNVFEEESGSLPSAGNNYELVYTAIVTPTNNNVPYKVRLTINDEIVYESSSYLYGVNSVSGHIDYPESLTYDVKAEVICETALTFDVDTLLRRLVFTTSFNYVFISGWPKNYTGETITLSTVITNELPDLKVYDVLTGIFKMFNLTAVPVDEQIYIQDLPSWYSQGQIYDITQFVDTTSETVKRGNILKKIDFKFQESEQILADQYYQSNKQWYGNLEFLLANENGDPLTDVDGDTLEIEAPFENPIYERLFDLSDNTQTTVQYCLYTDRQIESISEAPFIFYAPLTSVVGNPLGFLNDGVYEEINTSVFMPSHSMQIDTESFNLNFNAEINEYTSSIFQDTLYKRFYEDYIGDIFSTKRRLYEYDAILPSYFLSILKLNDRLIIKDRRYIINSISSTLSPDRKDRLELINDIYDAPLETDTLNTNAFRRTEGFYNYKSQRDSVTFVGSSQPQEIKITNLDGVSTFVTLDDVITDSKTFEVGFSLSENTTGALRACYLYMNNNTSGTRYYIIQYPNNVWSLNYQNNKNLIMNNIILTGKA